MSLSNDIVLRPRFKFDVAFPNETLLQSFESAKTSQSEFILSRVDDHVFIRLPKKNQHFWSPQLHLEINEKDSNNCTVHGLYGPSPTVWTLFMFLHFVVAGLFFGFGIWAYTNVSLGHPYAVQLFLTIFMIILWFILYFAGRVGRAKGKPEMYLLRDFMEKTLADYR